MRVYKIYFSAPSYYPPGAVRLHGGRVWLWCQYRKRVRIRS